MIVHWTVVMALFISLAALCTASAVPFQRWDQAHRYIAPLAISRLDSLFEGQVRDLFVISWLRSMPILLFTVAYALACLSILIAKSVGQ